MRRISKGSDSGFTIMELTAATGLLIFVISAFAVSLNGTLGLERVYQSESRALVVLNNTLERLGIQENCTVALAERILMHELSESPLGAQDECTAVCEVTDQVLILAIDTREGRRLAKVAIEEKQ
jgi:hypothetical protein